MSLSVGIVGLPNVGKSTLFNALLKKQLAFAANFPFATIEPNIGVVPVPDDRLAKLAEVIANSHPELVSGSSSDSGSESGMTKKMPPEVPATVEFVDIAGLIAGAHKGEGLGNKFLSHIRETDAIVHVVRAFTDEDIIKEGSVDPKADLEVIETELMMADLNTLENQKSKSRKQGENPKFKSYVDKAIQAVTSGKAVRELDFLDEELKEGKQLGLLTAKPILVVLNVNEEDLKNSSNIEEEFAQKFGLSKNQVIAINAKIEEELAGFDEVETKEYLKDLGVDETGLKRLIQKAFTTLGLITFLTAGEKEVRAWTIKNGFTAPEASGAIHTDFEKKFIKADVVSFEDFVNPGGLAEVGGLVSPKLGEGGWKGSRENGKVRIEGRDYIMKDGDVVEFKIGA